MSSNIKILVVEDEFLISKEVIEALKKLGYTKVYWAKNSKEALDFTAQHDITIALMDIGLKNSELDGIDIVKEIKGNCKIIFTTAYSDKATLERAGKIPHENYLIKPISERQLYVTIQQALNHSSEQSKVENSTVPFTQCPFISGTNEIYIKTGHDKFYYKYYVDDIVFIKSEKKGIQVFTASDEYFAYVGLQSAIKQINRQNVVQVHKSYAVNINHVMAKADGELMMANKHRVPIGRTFESKLSEYFVELKAKNE